MQPISTMYDTPFCGNLRKIQLVSNNLCYGPAPEPGEVVEQHLTITADGKVWLSHYCYPSSGVNYRLKEKEYFRISPDSTENIMYAVSSFFSDYSDLPDATDVGVWNLTLTNDRGYKYKYSGSLIEDLYFLDAGLSNMIRDELGRNDLFVFDGVRDDVTQLEIKYHRLTKGKSNISLPDGTENGWSWDYNEWLTVDRESETIEHVCEIGSGCKVTRTYHVEGGVPDFLDGMSIKTFSEPKGNPPDAIDDPLETRTYEINLYTSLGAHRVVTGTFDKHGLPSDWGRFITRLERFLDFYGSGELFDSRMYEKPKPRKSDLIFCKVVFDEYGQEYTYLADTNDYEVGDRVVVPVGPDDRETVAEIISVEYRQPEDAPFPLEMTKHILRKK